MTIKKGAKRPRKERNCHTCKRACHLLFLKMAKDMTKPTTRLFDVLKYGEECEDWYDMDEEASDD